MIELLIAPAGEAGEALGYSVGTAGDVNGDGFADIVLGAPASDAGAILAGRAYVYYGGPSVDSTPDLIFTGEARDDRLGNAVGTAGDVNGDGYADVIVGAFLKDDAPGSWVGRAYVYYGGAFTDSTADLVLTGEAAQDQFGIAVGTAGDVNGDGFDDFVVGAHYSDVGGLNNVGRAYVYYGGPSADATPDVILVGEAANDQFGHSVSAAGDMNGDGFDDFVVGAPGAERAYVYLGGSPVDGTADLILTGEGSDGFGESVGTAGDMNGDGFADIIVGAKYGAGWAGRAYVYHGGALADTTADLTLTGEALDDLFGWSVGTAGDVNGDGFDDVVVGSPHNDAAGSRSGRAYLFFGGPSADATADMVVTGEAESDSFGDTVGTAGDVNGDGLDDFVVGSHQNDTGGLSNGRAYVYGTRPYRVLSPNGGEQWVVGESAKVRWRGHDPADLEFSVDGGLTYDLLMSGVGGDPENEQTVIAPATPTHGARVRLTVHGEVPTSVNSDESDGVFRIVEHVIVPPVVCRSGTTFIGETAGDQFGICVGSAGDVNGDGFGDVVVGASLSDAGGADAGRAYLFHGGPVADATVDLLLTGEASGDRFGLSVGTAGDVNGDGFDDVVVGAFGSDVVGANAGRAYVYHGGPLADATADLTFDGEAAGDEFGYSVGTAGDINGDGYDDVIVGADFNSAGGAFAGRAYVYHGGPFADATADLTLTGEAAGDLFGVSVGTAGDVNGDGYDDVVVGAMYNDGGGSNAGRVYVYYGAPSADATADLILTGEAAADRFGISVGTAGDVNGDGYDDVIVGADFNDAGGADAGRAYVYYGGSTADAIADVILTGEAPGDQFGVSVGGAGDVNGDGFDDVVVGADYNDAGGSSAGRAYVYFGGPITDATADVVLAGKAAGDRLGVSVGAAGDVNGDGFDDFAVGAHLNDAGGENAGAAYVFDCARYFVTSPSGGDTWNVGATEVVTWLGAEPADVSLSVNGGAEFFTLATFVGGEESNALPLVVPHLPTRFARIRVSPTDPSVHGSDRSDSLFTIDASITLLFFQASFREGSDTQALIAWRTDPQPEDLAAYRLERAEGGSGWRTLVETRETEHLDEGATGGSRYRLTAINGLREEYLLGETTLGTIAPLAAWPLPYRGGKLHITFGTTGGIAGGPSSAEVVLYDVTGRKVRTIVQGDFPAGYHRAVWDGRDQAGRPIASGIYFLHVNTPGNVRSQKLAVVR